MNTTDSGEAPGSSHFRNGPRKREVFEAEKLADEASEMKAIHPISGTYLLTALRNEPRSSVDATDDICWFAALGNNGKRVNASHSDKPEVIRKSLRCRA